MLFFLHVLMRPVAACDCLSRRFFFFNDTATTEIYTLSLHDALLIADAGSEHGWIYRLRESAIFREPGACRALPHLHGRGADKLLYPGRQNELRTWHKPAIFPYGQRYTGPGHSARHQAIHEGIIR